jgi:hypothetical protein
MIKGTVIAMAAVIALFIGEDSEQTRSGKVVAEWSTPQLNGQFKPEKLNCIDLSQIAAKAQTEAMILNNMVKKCQRMGKQVCTTEKMMWGMASIIYLEASKVISNECVEIPPPSF